MEACNESTPANDRGTRSPPLLDSYKPLDYMTVRQEVENLNNLSAASLEEWRQEESMYEESFYDVDSSGAHAIETARRNYPNDRCKVKDPTLYPYHNACYPLLEAYTGNARMPNQLEVRIPGQLLCSVDAINSTVRGLSSSELDPHSSRHLAFSMQEEWKSGLDRRLQSGSDPEFWSRFDEADRNYAADKTYGLAHFPTDSKTRADILLKLLRHAMSDLQNDLLLASEVIVRMSRWNLFQNVDTLRRALCIIGSELKDCSGACFENLEWDDDLPDHSCKDWSCFEKKMSFLICSGIEYFTEMHAVVIAGHVQSYLDNKNPAAAELEASLLEETINHKPNQSTEDKHRTLLKQQLYLSKNTHYGYEDYESDSDETDNQTLSEMQQTDWTDDVIIGLSAHGVLARRRVVDLQDRLRKVSNQQERDDLIVVLRKSIDSFHNCARCLVYIGESAIRRLTLNPRVVGFCSRLVLCLVRLFLEPSIESFDPIKSDPRTYLKAGRSLIDPNRYADSVLAATKNYRRRHFPTSLPVEGHDQVVQESIEMAHRFLETPPDRDVCDLIWCLFAKDLVSPVVSRCGYGDIQVWLGFPVTPLDPLLFPDDSNCPGKDVIENIWYSMDEEPMPWETDEEGSELWGDRLHARYDFSLSLLLCAWHAPWSIESHHSFQRPFREAVTTLLLCANRIRMPTDIVSNVCSYLSRHWWPDERDQCFLFGCPGKRATKLLHQKLIHQMASTTENLKRLQFARGCKPCTSCHECRVTLYCSKAHEQSDYRDCHKGSCGMPPFRIPGQKEQALFNDVLSWQQNEAAPTVFNDAVICLLESQLQRSPDVLDDGSGSWESVESDEDEVDDRLEALTDIVHRFFERECYRIVRADLAR